MSLDKRAERHRRRSAAYLAAAKANVALVASFGRKGSAEKKSASLPWWKRWLA